MTIRFATTLTAAILMVLAALTGTVSASGGGGIERATIHAFGSGAEIQDTFAWLHRSREGILMALRTTGLEAGSAYTVWWVVFNRPGACTTDTDDTTRCGADDLERPEVEASAMYAAGNVAAGSGHVTFGDHLSVGEVADCNPGLPCGNGLTDPDGAEVHLVVRTHGPADPDAVDEQLSTFNGGCESGQPNEGKCDNVQAAAFPGS